jgi:glycosyltransferase involved in cell wall biosynthesis
MITVHKRRGTWSNSVSRYIALTNFARNIFIEDGFPSDRVDVKPNFIEDPGPPPPSVNRTGVLFVGRLSQEKGVQILVEAARQFGFPVRIAGTGPQMEALRRGAPSVVTFLGPIQREVVIAEMCRAVAVVLPSTWYEGFPMVIIEAFACATPVIASDLGGLSEIVEDGKTGLLAASGDTMALGKQITRLLADQVLSRQLGDAARRTFLKKYTPDVNLKSLESIYAKAVSK